MSTSKQTCIQYISDIHLEFIDHPIKLKKIVEKIIPIAPICVLAGDIGYPFHPYYSQFLEEMSKKFNHILLIHGNHEYYQLGKNKGKTMNEILEKTKEIVKSLPNVHFLHNSYVDIDDIRFIGSVLWTELKNPKALVNDARSIQEFTVDHFNQIHEENKTFIRNTIEQSRDENKRIIMITHHLPSYELIDQSFVKYGDYNQCFASSCDEFINDPVILWIYGHTHLPNVQMINNIKCVANPIGYPGELAKPNYTQYVII